MREKSADDKVLLAWSGGKDSAFALYEIWRAGKQKVVALLVTVTEVYDRVSMHGVRESLLQRQANAFGLTLEKVFIPTHVTNEEYESKMRQALEKYLALGISSVVFGDIFLEDLRRFREDRLGSIGLRGIFPLWGHDTTSLARDFIALGFKAIVTCVDSQVLDRRFLGRELDERFFSELPTTVDPCGENGEFHTFVYDGPIFREGLSFKKGEIVFRENRFYYCDLIPL